MANKIAVWRERLRLVATATAGIVDGEIVLPIQRWYLQNVAVKNDTTANSDCILSVYDGSYSHVLYYFENLGSNVWSNVKISLWLMEMERIRLEWSSIISGDILDVHISGQKRFKEG